MKKFMSIVMAAVMAVSLSACGNSKPQSSEAPKTGDTKQQTTSSGSSNNSLTVWCWDPAFNLYAMEQAAIVYKKTNPDFNLNIIETPWQDIQTKMTTAAVAGDYSTLPDIFLCQDNAFQKNVISFPNLFTDITSSGIKFSDFGKSKVAYSVVDGKNYGVPFDNGAVISALRTDYLEEAGYTVEDFTDVTWSRYIEMGKDILAKTGKPLLSMQSGESDLIMMMLQSAGASLFDEKGNPTMADNAVLKEVISVYVELVKSGVLTQVNDWDQYVGTITNGTVAGTINGCWILGTIQSSKDQVEKWAITNMPKLDNVSTATNYSNNGGSSWAVSANCKNVELATDFLSKTFAGSVEFYETILSKSGALATYIPAGSSTAYKEPQEFFGGEAIFAKITDFASKVPSNNTGVYYYEARDAVAVAMTNVISGGNIDTELKNADSTVKFAMGK